jgi:hypothetical protein
MEDLVEPCCDLPLKSFTIHVRSFHPESTFGLSGLFYHGDNRGYSNVPRPIGQRGKGAPPTSRVEHWIEFDTNKPAIKDKGVSSDPSQWIIGAEHRYDAESGRRLPTLEASLRDDTNPNDRCRRQLTIQSHHLGYNEAVKWELLRKGVPGLDVFGEFMIELDCKSKTLTVTTRITGDAFPNVEAFIVDANGTSVFLGVHEREGTPPAALYGENKRFMFSSSLTIDLKGDGNFSDMLTVHTYKTVYDPGTRGFVNSRESVSNWNRKFLSMSPTTTERKIIDQLPPYVPDVIDKIFDTISPGKLY